MNNTTPNLISPVQFTGVADDDTTLEPISIRALKLRKYDAAFIKSDDEIELTAILAGQDKEWVLNLSPASYEQLVAVVEKVNQTGFFVYCGRRKAALYQTLSKMKPEILAMAAEKVLPNSPPGLLPK